MYVESKSDVKFDLDPKIKVKQDIVNLLWLM